MTIRLAVLVTLALLSPAVAEEQPCRGDIEKLCASVQLGGGALMECLRKNAAQLSAPCRDRLQTLQAEFGGGTDGTPPSGAPAPSPMSACLRDATVHCRASGSDPESALTCLKSHEKDLSSGCRDALEKAGAL